MTGNRPEFDLALALQSIVSVQAGEVYQTATEAIDIAIDAGEDPRCVMEQILLVAVIHALENKLELRVIKSVMDAYRGALSCLAVAYNSNNIPEA